MKLIIDIPKKEYEGFKELIAINIGGRCSGKGIIQTCLNAVKNGTPLPKNHGRLIDADVLADGFEDNYEFCEVVNATPTVIEADKESEE